MSGAWLVHVAAWFLPIVKGLDTFPKVVPGWYAFRVASCGVWPCEDMHFDTWFGAVLSALSAITTLLFVLGSPWVILRGSHSMRRASAWVAAISFIVNVHWYVLFGSDRSDLRIGYFLWWLSFMFLAIGLFDFTQPRRVDESKESQSASATTG